MRPEMRIAPDVNVCGALDAACAPSAVPVVLSAMLRVLEANARPGRGVTRATTTDEARA